MPLSEIGVIYWKFDANFAIFESLLVYVLKNRIICIGKDAAIRNSCYFLKMCVWVLISVGFLFVANRQASKLNSSMPVLLKPRLSSALKLLVSRRSSKSKSLNWKCLLMLLTRQTSISRRQLRNRAWPWPNSKLTMMKFNVNYKLLWINLASLKEKYKLLLPNARTSGATMKP